MNDLTDLQEIPRHLNTFSELRYESSKARTPFRAVLFDLRTCPRYVILRVRTIPNSPVVYDLRRRTITFAYLFVQRCSSPEVRRLRGHLQAMTSLILKNG